MFSWLPFPLRAVVTTYTAFLLFPTPSWFSKPSGCLCLYLYANAVPSSPLNLPAQTPLSDTNYAVANGGPRANCEIEVGFIWWKQLLSSNLKRESNRTKQSAVWKAVYGLGQSSSVNGHFTIQTEKIHLNENGSENIPVACCNLSKCLFWCWNRNICLYLLTLNNCGQYSAVY